MNNKSALLVVDVQAAFAIPPQLVAAIEKESLGYERRIFTKFVNLPRSLFRVALGKDSCTPGSPDTRLLIPPRKGDLVFRKPAYGLLRSQLVKLHELKISRIDVCGVDTDACVLGVMFSLFDAKILPRVLPSLCWSAQDLHTQAVEIMRSQFGK